MESKNEIVVYEPDSSTKMEVILENSTIWLSKVKIAELFGVDRTVITKHIRNIYNTGELSEKATCAKNAQVQIEGGRQVTRYHDIFSLDMIIAVGYRVNSLRATRFRIWATDVLTSYLLRGYSINARFNQLEDKVDRRLAEHDQQIIELKDRVDFFVRTELPPKEGVLFQGQIKDGYDLIVRLIRSAKKSVVLIDNWIDERVLTMMESRGEKVSATIYTKNYSKKLKLDVENHNRQYRPINVRAYRGAHDRFLLIDNTTYHIGASLKDLGMALTAFTQMEVPASVILERIMGK